MHRAHLLKCGALLYGYMLDLDGRPASRSGAAVPFTNPKRPPRSHFCPGPAAAIVPGKGAFRRLNDSIVLLPRRRSA